MTSIFINNIHIPLVFDLSISGIDFLLCFLNILNSPFYFSLFAHFNNIIMLVKSVVALLHQYDLVNIIS